MKSPLFFLLLAASLLLGSPLGFSQGLVPLALVREGVPPLVLIEPPPDPPALIGWLGSPNLRPQGHLGPVLFHPNGRQMLAYEYGNNDDDFLSLWQSPAGSAKLVLAGTFPVVKPWNLSADGQFICGVATKGWNQKGAFSVWKFPSGDPVWQIAKDHAATVNATAFSQDARVLALLWQVGQIQQISILETVTGKVIREIPLASTAFNSRELPTIMVFSSSSLLLSPALDEKGRLIEIPFSDWTPRFHPTSPPDSFEDDWESNTRLDLSRDGKWLAIWNRRQCLVMEFRTGQWTTKLPSYEEWCALGDDSPYQTVAFTPDSKRVLLSGGSHHRIVELSNGKVLSHDASGCRCGVFHPAGRVFVRTCYPFEVNDATSFAPLPGGEVSGHTDAMEDFDFMDAGAKLISTSAQFAHVWDLSGEPLSSEPLSRLILPPRDTPWSLSRLAWLPSLNEIQGSDSFDFFRWKLPADGQPWPQTLVGEFAFRGRESMRDMGLMMSVFPTPDGKSAIYHSNTGPFIVRTLDKDPSKVTSRPLALKSLNEMTGEFRYHFMPDSKSFVYNSYSGLASYDLTTDQITKVKPTDSADLAGHSLATGKIAGFTQGLLVLYNDKTLAVLSKTPFKTPNIPIHFKRADFSADGKWLACMTFDMNKGTESLWLIDAEKLELAAVQRVQPRTSDQVKFTPDSQRLIVGHAGGSISVWDVAKLVATAPPSAELKAATRPPAPTNAFNPANAPGTPSNTPGSAPSGYQLFTEVPSTPLLPDKVTPWVWSPDCSANVADGTLQIGTLKINGQALAVLSASGNTRAEWQTLSGKLELQAQLANQESVLVTRDVFCDPSGTAYWADRLRNPTSSVKNIEVSFEFGFARDWSELEAGNRTRLTLDGNIVRLPKGEECIVSHLTQPDGKRHASHVRLFINGVEGLPKPEHEAFSMLSTPAIVRPETEPELRWDPARRLFQATYKVTLGPFEHRLLLHIGRSSPILDSLTLNDYSRDLSALNVGTYKWFQPENLEIALNFATPTSIWIAKESGTLFKPRPEPQDQFGFTWRPDFNGYGLSNQLMLKRGLHCHADGWPLIAYKGQREDGFQRHHASRQGDVCLAEKATFSPSLGYRVETRVRYDGDADRQVEVTFVNLLRQPIEQILNHKGESIPLDRVIASAVLGKKFALVGKAEDQPSALFSLGAIAANAAPELRFVDHQTLEIVYQLPMKPGQKIDLLHLTAQQPLSAFPSPADMMAQWPPH